MMMMKALLVLSSTLLISKVTASSPSSSGVVVRIDFHQHDVYPPRVAVLSLSLSTIFFVRIQ